MKWLRILLSLVILLIIVAGLGLACLAIFFDPSKLKPIIISEIKKHAGYEVIMDGQLSWSFYPQLGVNVSHMTLRAPDQSSPFLDLTDVNIATKLVQLLQGNKKLEGDVTIAEVMVNGLHLQKARVHLTWAQQMLTLNPITALLYDGKLEGNIQSNPLAATPQWAINITVNQIQIKPLLSDINGSQGKLKLSGVGQVSLQVKTAGKTRAELINHLNGVSEVGVSQGVLEGIDLNYFIKSADALMNKKLLPELPTEQQTAFDRLHSSFVINNGVAHTADLLLASPAFTTQGEGDIDLAAEKLDLQLQITPIDVATKWTVPIVINGDWHQPSVTLNISKLNTLITKEQIEKANEKVKEELKKLPDQANQLLQNLLGH